MRDLLNRSRWISLLLIALATPATANGRTRGDVIADSATNVLDQVMSRPGKKIPRHLMNQAHGVAIVPGVVKGGFVVGVRRGRGVVLVRDAAGNWQPPTFVTLSGGSVGWQAGIQSTDVVLVFKTPGSVQNLMHGRLKIGVDAAAAAGPVGRGAEAATDARLSAEIYSYSRSRGLFAGVSLEGSALEIDHATGRAYYRNDAAGNPMALPESAVRLMDRVAHYSGSPQTVSAEYPTPSSLGPSVLQRDPPSQAETIRQQLIASWTELSPLLDDQWTTYLALPADLVTGEQNVPPEALDAVLQGYAAAANDPQYASLARRQEFLATHQLLREYIAVQSSEAKRLKLPPPPNR